MRKEISYKVENEIWKKAQEIFLNKNMENKRFYMKLLIN